MIIKAMEFNDVDSRFVPNLFETEKNKQGKKYIKQLMDYFGSIAHAQYSQNEKTFAHNYNLVKGILRKEDFFINDNDVAQSFVDVLLKDIDLPEHVKHYSILNPPINTLMGELSKRPDYSKIKAMDDNSKSEELQYRTEHMQKYILETAANQIKMSIAQNGQEEPEDEDVQKMAMEKVAEYITDYTSMAERWASRMLEYCKLEFNTKHIAEQIFRDFIIVARPAAHVFEDNSDIGFSIEEVNPKKIWKLSSPDKMFLSDPSGRNNCAYTVGILDVMEISEIIQKFNLPKEEIDHLRKLSNEYPNMSARPSNLHSPVTGDKSFTYDTYHEGALEEKIVADGLFMGNQDAANEFLGSRPQNANSFDNKFTVIQSYHLGKTKIGLLTYYDEQGEPQTTYVDDSYEKVPNEISVEWEYVNQWYKGLRVGSEIYHMEPFKLFEYCPIFGFVHEAKNTSEVKSLVDMLKYFQTIYNVCMNQIFKLLEKEYGQVLLSSLRTVPMSKDSDGQDAVDVMEAEMRARGAVYYDDSPENIKGGPSSGMQIKALDLTRTNEIKSRWELAQAIKQEAWELVGMSKARTSSITPSQSATATQTELSQSYAQTEPYFTMHEYLMNQIYQGLVDAAQHMALQKPESTLSYVNTQGEQSFININSDELTMRKLKLFTTSRAEDERKFQELRQLAQPMLQNGASVYDVSMLWATSSIRQMRDIFKSLEQKRDAYMQQEQQLKQQELETMQQSTQQQLAAQAEEKERDRQFQGQQKALDRESNERRAIITATGFGQTPSEDLDNDTIPDVLEASRLTLEHQNSLTATQLKQQELAQKQRESSQKGDIENKKIALAEKNMKNDKEIALINARNKPKPKTSK
jgi:hypothetical protein